MDNAYNQSAVAYESSPKEKNVKRGLHDGNKQFGKANKMAQDEKSISKSRGKRIELQHKGHHRHKEHR